MDPENGTLEDCYGKTPGGLSREPFQPTPVLSARPRLVRVRHFDVQVQVGVYREPRATCHARGKPRRHARWGAGPWGRG